LTEAEEIRLYHAVSQAKTSLNQSPSFENALVQVEGLVSPINAFFDKVLVMVEDQVLRESRLGILQRIAGLIRPYADLSKLEGF
jgi:glycyl-tRNA synthetase beta subunit